MQVLKLIPLALEISPELGGASWFADRHSIDEPNGSILRLLHYPASAEQIGAGAHTDYGSLTLLFQQAGMGGLQVHINNGWVSVPAPSSNLKEAPPILVNIADQLSFWTAGLFKSSLHRVFLPRDPYHRVRRSIAYFCHPADNTILKPVPSRLVTDLAQGANVESVTAAEHLRRRLALAYRWEKENT